jgi:hypothetical protein
MSDEITASAYHKQIKAIAKECLERAKESGEELSDVIWETVDGHEWVIYTRFHHQVLHLCDTDVAARLEDMGGADLSKGWDNVVMQATFLALEGDVSELAQEMEKDNE